MRGPRPRPASSCARRWLKVFCRSLSSTSSTGRRLTLWQWQDRVLELLLELGATEDQFEVPVLYGSAKEGYFVTDLADQKRDSVEPLIEVILERVPPPQVDAGAPFRMLVSNIDWDDYVGRIALGRVESGEVRKGDALWLLRLDGSTVHSTITKVFEYAKLGTQDAAVGEAGNIVGWRALKTSTSVKPSRPRSRPRCCPSWPSIPLPCRCSLR